MKNNYLAPQVSYEHSIRQMDVDALKAEYSLILDKGNLSEDDKKHLILINKTYYQLTHTYLHQL